jgi:hypothetical protein
LQGGVSALQHIFGDTPNKSSAEIFQHCYDLGQSLESNCRIDLVMSGERARDLAQFCTELVRGGTDFPTVWNTVLKGNALVDGIPQTKLEDTRSVLEILLITGERLVFDGDAKKFSVK